MRIRTIYILLLVLMAVCLYALDRSIARTYADHDNTLLAAMAQSHAQLCEEYFATRISATEAFGLEVEGTDDAKAARFFQSTARFVCDHISGIHHLMLLDRQSRRITEWPDTGGEHVIPESLLLGAAQDALRSRSASVSRAFHLPTMDAYCYLIADPVPDDTGRVTVACVALPPSITPTPKGTPASKPFTYLEDSSGALLTPSPSVEGKAPEQRETFTVGKDSWAVHVREPATARGRLFLARLAILMIGVLLLTVPAVLYVLHANQHAALAQANAKLEAELGLARRFNARLIRLNYELDEFTHIVSHDLKEPLRGVDGLSRMFMEEYGEKLDDQGKEYLRSIRASGARMRQLVDDLLHLSRIGRRRYPPEEVDFNDLVREVLTSLQFTISARSAHVTVQEGLPRIVCDRVRMAELFQNLLSNALKFGGDRAPEIQVGCRTGSEEQLFWVKDNGIGIAAQDQSRVFQIFQRLDPHTDGSGLGLTICKRIVENHGGRIWVESEPGAGSTFLFTLPRRSAANLGDADAAADEKATG